MDIEKLIEDLRGLLKQCGEKIPYGELVGAPWPYSRSGDLVWQDPEPYFIEQAATALSTLRVENEKLRDELDSVKCERDAAIKDLFEIIGDIEEIRCGYGVDNADTDEAFAELCNGYCANAGNFCYKEGEHYRCKHFNWRGPQKEG